ncbi:MAG: ABC transporter permease subunit [Pseudomonadota bacterium]
MSINTLERYKKLIITIPFLWISVFIILAVILLSLISLSSLEFGVTPYKLLFQFKDDGLEIKPDFGSYLMIFKDNFYLKAFINSLKLAFIATFFTLIIAYPMAYSISKANENLRIFFLILIITPFWTSLLIRVYGWISILKNNGLLNQFLLMSGIIDEPLHLLNTQFAIIIGIVYTYLPFMVLPIYSSLLKIKPNIIEAAADLGAKPFSIFWQIIFPLSLPGVIMGLFLAFIPSIGEFVVPDLLGGAKIITIGKLLWTEFFMNRDWPMASAITILIIFIVVIPIKLLHRFINNNG